MGFAMEPPDEPEDDGCSFLRAIGWVVIVLFTVGAFLAASAVARDAIRAMRQAAEGL